MKRDTLVNEIAEFGFKYGVFNKSLGVDEIKKGLEDMLEDSAFIETLINTIIIKTKGNKNIDTRKLKLILLHLEKIRLELEYDDYDDSSEDCEKSLDEWTNSPTK